MRQRRDALDVGKSQGRHSCDVIATAAEVRTLWLQELAKQNILAGVPWFPMTVWDEGLVTQLRDGIDYALFTISEVVEHRKPIGDMLEVPIISDVFSRYEAPRESW